MFLGTLQSVKHLWHEACQSSGTDVYDSIQQRILKATAINFICESLWLLSCKLIQVMQKPYFSFMRITSCAMVTHIIHNTTYKKAHTA